jgi:undecaprenyl diphosphate synthase
MERTPDSPAVPVHVAFIMDGNGRWARQRGQARVMGHQKGAETVKMVKAACLDFNIPYLTLYAFSQENWKRPKNEVDFLMDLLDKYLESEAAGVVKDGIRFRTIGDLTALSPGIQDKIARLRALTASNTRLTLTLALNYGSRQEILTSVRRFVDSVLRKPGVSVDDLRRAAASLDEKTLASFLDTAGTPDPDLLIRTSGEMRLSNFLLWQCSYSEIYVSDKLWPDFSRADFEAALAEFAARERRFGAVL